MKVAHSSFFLPTRKEATVSCPHSLLQARDHFRIAFMLLSEILAESNSLGKSRVVPGKWAYVVTLVLQSSCQRQIISLNAIPQGIFEGLVAKVPLAVKSCLQPLDQKFLRSVQG